MSAEFTLIALRPDELSRWKYLSSVDIWMGRQEIYSVETYAANGLVAGTSAEFDEYIHMIETFHLEDRALFISEVSMMKAGLMMNYDRYIPRPTQRVAAVLKKLGDRPLDATHSRAITIAMNTSNTSIYRHRSLHWNTVSYGQGSGWQRMKPWYPRRRGVQKARHVKQWTQAHIGYHIDYVIE